MFSSHCTQTLQIAIEQWKIMEATQQNPSPKPAIEQFGQIYKQTKAHNKVAKFMGMHSSSRFYTDWCMAAPEQKTRKKIPWEVFLKTMSAYYKPTENINLKHFHYRSNIQRDGETFIAFCIRVLLEAKALQFQMRIR